MSQSTKARKQREIISPVLYRVVSKSGEFLGYLVKSNSNENYYQVTWNYTLKCYECNCPATVKCCCHVKAVSEVCQARIATQKASQEQAKRQRWISYNVAGFYEALYVYAIQQVAQGESIQVVAANKEVKSLAKVAPKQPATKGNASLSGRNFKIVNGVPMR